MSYACFPNMVFGIFDSALIRNPIFTTHGFHFSSFLIKVTVLVSVIHDSNILLITAIANKCLDFYKLFFETIV